MERADELYISFIQTKTMWVPNLLWVINSQKFKGRTMKINDSIIRKFNILNVG